MQFLPVEVDYKSLITPIKDKDATKMCLPQKKPDEIKDLDKIYDKKIQENYSPFDCDNPLMLLINNCIKYQIQTYIIYFLIFFIVCIFVILVLFRYKNY